MHPLFALSAATLLSLLAESVLVILRRSAGLPKRVSVPTLALFALWVSYLGSFALSDLSLRAVYENTSTNMPLLLRIAASWASGEGALLYVALFASLPYFILRAKGETNAALILANNLLAAILLGLATVNGAFDEASFTAPAGTGLNPLLKSPWMYVHPLLSLSSYGLSLSAFVAVAALRKKAESHVKKILRLGWLLITAALLTGALWSYTTFGWGGYWAWDPVETAQLVIWLAITAALHGRSIGPKTFELGAYLTGASVFLAMLVTRAGVSPLHGFASVQELTGLTYAAAFFVCLYFAFAKSAGFFEELKAAVKPKTPLKVGILLNYAALMAALIFLLSSLLGPSLVALLGKQVSPPQGDSAVRLYHPILFMLTLLMLFSLPLCSIGRSFSWRALSGLLAGAATVSAIFAYLTIRGDLVWSPHGSFATNLYISVLAPLAALGTASALVHALSSVLRGELSTSVSSAIVHIGIGLLVIGVLLSGSHSYSRDIFRSATLYPGQTEVIRGTSIELAKYSYSLSDSQVQISVSPEGGRIDTMALAAQYLMATELTQIANITRMAELKISEMGLSWAFDARALPAAPKAEEYDCFAQLSNNATEQCQLRLNATSVIPLASQVGAQVVVQALVSSTVALKGSEAVQGEASSSGGLILSFPDRPLALRSRGMTFLINKASLLPFDFEEHALRTFRVRDGELYCENCTLVAIEGIVLTDKGELPLPVVISDPHVVMYYSFSANDAIRPLLQLLRETGLFDDFAAGGVFQRPRGEIPPNCQSGNLTLDCLKPFSFSLLVPETAYLELSIKSGGRESEAGLRFEVAGEVKGVHGLVPKVVTVRKGLSELYLVLMPPLYSESAEQTPYFHDLMVYYVSSMRTALASEDLLRLCTVLVSGYYAGVSNIGPADVVYLALALYGQALGYSPAIDREGLAVQYKEIPGVNLIWIGGLTMIIGGALQAAGLRNRSATRGKGVE